MNKTEAREILARELVSLHSKSYEDLQELIASPQVLERVGDSGVSYQIEIEAFWDHPDGAGGDLRVFASIDDGGFLSAFFPLSSDFVMTSHGKIKRD